MMTDQVKAKKGYTADDLPAGTGPHGAALASHSAESAVSTSAGPEAQDTGVAKMGVSNPAQADVDDPKGA
jgi:hypothetical protein